MWYLLFANTTFAYTHADTLRGSNGNGRNWWDVQHYLLAVDLDTATHCIIGTNDIQFRITGVTGDSMQIDLQQPMVLDSVFFNGITLKIANEGNVWWVKYPFHLLTIGATYSVRCFYHGIPRTAVRPPWDGGFVWTRDSTGKTWISVACQGLGASVWWPCKDAQWDEPDLGQDMEFTVLGNTPCISNGKLVAKKSNADKTTWHWQVKNPINSYDVTFYIGDYVHWSDTLWGEKGTLNIDLYALRNNEEKARKQFAVVKSMLHCFEYWMGTYPFYEDGYKLVEAPYLGMEHQSAVAYGNKYQMGYLGYDRSGMGIGLKFDYIIVHETGHEWFGNNITASDIADNWIHEGITTFSESLFADCLLGKEASGAYSRGNWSAIRNDRPLIGDYGVNNEGSGDIYRKGAAMMYMIRVLINDDQKFRSMMRGLTDSFFHKMVTTAQIENYIAYYLPGMDMKPFFNQYLRSTEIPELEYFVRKRRLHYRLLHCVAGFTLPVQVNDTKGRSHVLNLSADWQTVRWDNKPPVSFSRDMLIKINGTY